MRAAIYARVSTTEQDPGLQLRELRAYVRRAGWRLASTFVDRGESGATDRRPELDRLMASVRRRDLDAVVVWKFDRFGRSVRQLVLALEELHELGVRFVSITEAIDTDTALGRAMFTIISAIAEFERELLRERVRAGVAKARADGKTLGRPRAVFDLEAARARRRAGASVRAVAAELGLHHKTLARALARRGAKSPSKSRP